jgi:HAD superfamily hydrolase (TIGR01484 family)
MRPLAELRGANDLRGLLFDIDDTLTTEGRLGAAAYSALERLHDGGRIAVAITGRPAGWCDHIARMWPVHAVVGENGALYFWYDPRAGRLRKRYHDPDDLRARNRGRLASIAERILAAVPGSALASDQGYREADLAIDYCEDVPPLPLEAAERIATLMRAEGLSARISSIHVNGWFGDYDKLASARALFSERFNTDLAREQRHFAFVGDSPNDEPMFEFFDHSIGVANVARFRAGLATAPKYVTRAAAGEGFTELVSLMLGAAR